MKFLFRLFMALHVALYRLTGGKLGGRLGAHKIILLTTRGRKSGKRFTTPLGYFDDPGGCLVIASNGGSPRSPGWYHNLKSSPQVSVQIMDRVLPASAEVLSGEARARAWQQIITAAPNYAAYQSKTTREIPVILLRPNR